MIQFLSVIVGGVSGLYWEYIANKPFGKHKALVKSVYVNFGDYKYHAHHWLLYVIVLGLVVLWAYQTGKLMHPAVVFGVSFLIAALVYGFTKLSGWGMFIE